MGVITTGIISFSLIAINVGFTDCFLHIWPRSWMAAYIIVIPVILLVSPQVQKLVNSVVKGANR
jgi:hypothetical protein